MRCALTQIRRKEGRHCGLFLIAAAQFGTNCDRAMASYLKEEYSALRRLGKTQTDKTNQSQEMIGRGCWRETGGDRVWQCFLNEHNVTQHQLHMFLMGVINVFFVFFGNQLS